MKIFWHGVLGMNARNLRYIREKNDIASISLADSKVKTKNFLSWRGIPFAETYTVLSSPVALSQFSFQSIPHSSFVIKPNQGSKWQGILIVKRKKDGKYSVSGEIWTEDDLRLHMLDILSGAFSLHGNHDRVVIEELLIPGRDFSRYCRYGLADIRVIVYNFVPLTAMVRMPTQASWGKANLAQWGIGLGLDIATGQVLNFFQYKKNYTREFPEPYGFLHGSFVPFWDHILLLSSRVQAYTGLGYLALDWVITKNGPKLLEINARAGLEIQNVNLVPLAKRLEQVSALRISSPEKGVEIAKTLFSSKTSTDAIGKQVIAFEQLAKLGWHHVTLRVDPYRQYTAISPDILKQFGQTGTISVDSQTHVIFHSEAVLESERALIVLGQNDLANVLIRPQVTVSWVQKSNSRWSSAIHEIDDAVSRLSKKTIFSSILRPKNYHQELDRFLSDPFHYNPVFVYNFPDTDFVQGFSDEVSRVRSLLEKVVWERHLVELYHEKLDEITDRMGLLDAYQYEDYSKIDYYNTRLFGAFDPVLTEESTKKILALPHRSEKKEASMLGNILTLDDIISAVESYFAEHQIRPIPIQVSSNTFSRIAVAYKKGDATIKIAEHALIREGEIRAILEHEVGTHLRRYLAGIDTGLRLFSEGTGYYIRDEEWLAVYNSFRHLPSGYEKNAMYHKYYFLSQVDTLSFSQTVGLLHSVQSSLSNERLFSSATRLKRGMIHTDVSGQPGTTYRKDKIYLDGYTLVRDWIGEWGDISLLSFGKIKIKDLPRIAHL